MSTLYIAQHSSFSPFLSLPAAAACGAKPARNDELHAAPHELPAASEDTAGWRLCGRRQEQSREICRSENGRDCTLHPSDPAE